MKNQDTHPGGQSSSTPGILLVGTNRWPLVARLASGFLELGCRVAAVGPIPGHPVAKVRSSVHLYRYSGRHPLESLRTAIDDFAPDMIIPSCDLSVQHLHRLYAGSNTDTEHACRLRSVIERSLGAPSSYPIVSSRYELLMLAKDEGIRVPSTIRVESMEDLKNWRDRQPRLLKADGTWGGRGVRKAESPANAEKALRELSNGTSAFQTAKQLLLNRDWEWTISNSHSVRPGIIAQTVVPGRPANCAVVSWNGEVLAGIAVEVVQADGPLHPAIVVQVVEGREMLDAAKWIARRLQLTGFFGLDFMIEDRSGDLYLIEMNPRCAPPCSLNLGEGRDLLAAIWAKLTKQNVPRRQPATQKTRIAYFPQATQRNVESPDSAYLDIPNGEPELVEEMLHPWSERNLIGKLLDLFRGKPSARKSFSPCVFNVAQLKDGSVPERELV